MTPLAFRAVIEQLERENPGALGLTLGDPVVMAAVERVETQAAQWAPIAPPAGFSCRDCDRCGFRSASSLFCHLLECTQFGVAARFRARRAD